MMIKMRKQIVDTLVGALIIGILIGVPYMVGHLSHPTVNGLPASSFIVFVVGAVIVVLFCSALLMFNTIGEYIMKQIRRKSKKINANKNRDVAIAACKSVLVAAVDAHGPILIPNEVIQSDTPGKIVCERRKDGLLTWYEKADKASNPDCSAHTEMVEFRDAIDEGAGWHTMDSAPLDGQFVDLYGVIDYDFTPLRLPDCSYVNGKWTWSYGDINEQGFQPEYWRHPPQPPIMFKSATLED